EIGRGVRRTVTVIPSSSTGSSESAATGCCARSSPTPAASDSRIAKPTFERILNEALRDLLRPALRRARETPHSGACIESRPGVPDAGNLDPVDAGCKTALDRTSWTG